MKKIWIITISVLATAIIVGGGTYYFLNSKANKDKDVLNKSILDAELSLDSTTAQIASQRATAEATAKAAADTAAAAAALAKKYEGWRTFQSAEYGLSFKYPTAWPVAKAEIIAKDDSSSTTANQCVNLNSDILDANSVSRSMTLSKFSDYGSESAGDLEKIKAVFSSKSVAGLDSLTLPAARAKIWSHTTPEYVETADGKFRGLVYFVNIGQAYTFNLSVIALLTDGQSKIFQLQISGKSTKSDEYYKKSGDPEAAETEYTAFLAPLTTKSVEQPTIKEYNDTIIYVIKSLEEKK